MDRVILHCDLNNFFASVEALSHPEFRDVPMAVAGSSEDRRGIILAKNEHAKKFGVQTAEPIWQAKRKCPNLVLTRPHYPKYKEYSQKVYNIYLRYTDQVEPFGIDEAWLDVTGSQKLFGNGMDIAQSIKDTVKSETGLTLSVGVSFNKVFAKLGSDYRKPDAITEISRENFKNIVYPLPVSSLLFVGKSTCAKLAQYDITTIGDIASSSRELLTSMLGIRGGELHDYACGIGNSEVIRADQWEPPKSIGRGLTFKRNLLSMDEVRTAITPLAEDVAERLRRHSMWCNRVSVTIKDDALKTISRQCNIEPSTNLGRVIYNTAISLIEKNWDFKIPIRMLTVTAMNLSEEYRGIQLSLFDDTEASDTSDTDKLEKLETSVDRLKQRFGRNVISFASTKENDLGLEAIGRKESDDED